MARDHVGYIISKVIANIFIMKSYTGYNNRKKEEKRETRHVQTTTIRCTNKQLVPVYQNQTNESSNIINLESLLFGSYQDWQSSLRGTSSNFARNEGGVVSSAENLHISENGQTGTKVAAGY